MPKEATTAPQSGDAPTRGARARAISRVTVPYLAAAIFAAAAMAWYFFSFVPARLDYFFGLRFRALAVAAAQIKSKAENLAVSLDWAARDPGSPREYLAVLVPEIQITSTPPDETVLHLSAGKVTAIVAWDDVVRAAAPVSVRDFDDLILADSEGTTLWQRERTTPRIGNLKTLLNVEPEPAGWFTTSWQRHRTRVKKDQDAMQQIPVLAPLDFGGVSSYVFVQSVAPAAKGIGNKPPLYLAGIVSRRVVERQAMHIPVVWILLCVLPVALLFLALPFIKLATLTPKERYSFVDVALLGVAAVGAATLGAAIPFGPAVIDSSVDATLGNLAREIEHRFATETSMVLDLAGALQEPGARLAGQGRCQSTRTQGMSKPPSPSLEKKNEPSAMGCDLWTTIDRLKSAKTVDPVLSNIMPGSVELDIVAWLDRHGKQVEKWTTRSVATALVPHAPYAHFRDMVAGKTWTLVQRRPNQKLNETPFTLQPMRSPTTAQMGFVFAVRTDDFEQPYFVLNVRPHSVVDPLMPPGFGFAVISEDGSVLFHSEEGLSLAENLLDEIDNRDEVRAWAVAGHTMTWSGDYHGRPHRLHLQAMPGFANSRWRIVTFRETGPVFNPQLAILRMVAVNFAALMLAGALFWLYTVYTPRRVRDMWLVASPPTTTGVRLLVVLAAISAGLVGCTYFPSANRHLSKLYLWFLVLPLLAVVVARVSRQWRRDEHIPSQRLQNREIIFLVVVMGVAPGAGFTRLACRMQDTRGMESWLESARASWDARRLRVLDRVNAPSNSEETRKLLRATGVTRTWTSNDRDEPRYSYFTQIERIQLAGEVSTAGLPGSDTGQSILRYVLTWSPFRTKTTPAAEGVKVAAAASEFRLGPDMAGTMPVLTAKIGDDVRGDASVVRIILGIVVIGGALWALVWARKKLLAPIFLAPQTFEETMNSLPRGTDLVLLIGPPRTRKDQRVYEKIRDVVAGDREPHRIRLLDRELKEEDIDAEIIKIGILIRTGRVPLDGNGRLWVHVSNLESQLVSAASRSSVLKLLERLIDERDTGVPRIVIVTTSVDPVANFKDIFHEERKDIYVDVVPEIDLSRSSLLLSRFRRCYLPARCEVKAQMRWEHWLDYDASMWWRTVQLEADGYEPLEGIVTEIRSPVWKEHPPALEDLSRAFTARAEAAYQLLWTSCTRSEKLVLIQLAQEGMVNPKCYEIVGRLVAKGIVVTTPGLTVFNYTFRRFLRGIERGHVVADWEHMEGTGLWVTAGRLVGSSMILGGAFFFLTQDYPVQSLLPIVSGTGLFGIPLVRDIVTRLAGGRPNTTAPTA